jgi:hypothetical protein
MKQPLIAGFLALSSPIFALETQPWIGNKYEFDFESAFVYSRYHKVQGAATQLKGPSNVYDLFLDFGFTPEANVDVRAEIEFADSPQMNFNWRSIAIQGRYQWLDDISGDTVSLTTGLNIRGVPDRALHDVSCPYSSNANIELTAAVGKEWSTDGAWRMRTYGYATLGMANQGYPWTQELLVLQYNWRDTHALFLYGAGYFGFGNHQHVLVNHFDGWGNIQHQSIDLGFTYRYKFGIWGTLSLFYAHRVFAHNFPEHVNFVGIAYRIPFSLF